MTTNEWTCHCGARFRLDTLTGKTRMTSHRDNGCDSPALPAAPILLAKAPPKSQAVKYPGRKGKGGKGF